MVILIFLCSLFSDLKDWQILIKKIMQVTLGNVVQLYAKEWHADQIFAVWRIIEKGMNVRKQVYFNFVDLEKANDKSNKLVI